MVCGTHNLVRKPVSSLGKKALDGILYKIMQTCTKLEILDTSLSPIFEFCTGSGENLMF